MYFGIATVAFHNKKRDFHNKIPKPDSIQFIFDCERK